MGLIRCCSRLPGFGRNASAGNGRKPRVWRVQGRRVWLPGRYKLVERGGRGWVGGEVGGSGGPFSESARRGAPTVISVHPPGVNECNRDLSPVSTRAVVRSNRRMHLHYTSTPHRTPLAIFQQL